MSNENKHLDELRLLLGETSKEVENSFLNHSALISDVSENKYELDLMIFALGYFEGSKKELQADRDKVCKLEAIIKTVKNDYWFMINLLENYSTNKDESIKDCIERMKYRKPMFEIANDEG